MPEVYFRHIDELANNELKRFFSLVSTELVSRNLTKGDILLDKFDDNELEHLHTVVSAELFFRHLSEADLGRMIATKIRMV